MDGTIKFLGSGSAFNTEHFQSNAVVEIDGHKLLIDCGSMIDFMFERNGLQPQDIETYYISHLHADHIGGLESVAFKTYFNPSCERPNIVANHNVIKGLWTSLRGGLESIQDKIATLETYFDVRRVKQNGHFLFHDVKFQLNQVVHVSGGFSFMDSYGLIFELGGKKIFFTTDTQFAPNQLQDYYKSVDIVFHDCETAPFPSRVHAHYDELLTLPEEIKAKMYLYHYQPGVKPDCKAEGFLGWVEPGKFFDFKEKTNAGS